MSKPRLTISVRRGLRELAQLAEADIDADQSYECPRFTGQRLRDMRNAIYWAGKLDVSKPRKPAPEERDAT